jgi:hypothetical protein
VKISEWLIDNVDSHAIQDHAQLAEAFKVATGCEPCWPSHSVVTTRAVMADRGLGGIIDANAVGPVCWGYEVAAGLAATHANFRSEKYGRGRIYWECFEALEKVGK